MAPSGTWGHILYCSQQTKSNDLLSNQSRSFKSKSLYYTRHVLPRFLRKNKTLVLLFPKIVKPRSIVPPPACQLSRHCLAVAFLQTIPFEQVNSYAYWTIATCKRKKKDGKCSFSSCTVARPSVGGGNRIRIRPFWMGKSCSSASASSRAVPTCHSRSAFESSPRSKLHLEVEVPAWVTAACGCGAALPGEMSDYSSRKEL
jgi:hypothetical protein